jgi:hypothetical protein
MWLRCDFALIREVSGMRVWENFRATRKFSGWVHGKPRASGAEDMARPLRRAPGVLKPGSSWQRVISMSGVLVCVALLALWDESREAAAALEEWGECQSLVAQSVGADLNSRLDALEHDGQRMAEGAAPSPEDAFLWPASSDRGMRVPVALGGGRHIDFGVPFDRLFGGAGRVERPNALTVWVLPPGESRLVSADGRRVTMEPLRRALEGGPTWIALSPEDAEHLSLPRATALAGLARVNSSGTGRWGVAVVASAQPIADRSSRARARTIAALILTAALALAFRRP